MGAKHTKTTVTVHDGILDKRQFVNDKLTKQDSFNITETSTVLKSDEEWEKIIEKGYEDIPYCINPKLNGIEECMGLFPDPNKLERFSVTPGTTRCKTYFYRPGLVFNNPNDARLTTELGDVFDGTLCKIVYTDYNYDDMDLTRCCFSENTSACNKNLVNGYKTSHCNAIMQDKCVGNESDPKCILWLEENVNRSEDVALTFYSDYCKKNHDKEVCDYMCKVARSHLDYRSEYCDISLKEWCTNNPDNEKCHCVIVPSDKIPETEEYLGPKECWLSSCSSQSNSKWLYTSQLETRQKCNLTACVISIKDLVLNDNSSVELINSCVSGTTISSSRIVEKEENKYFEKTPGGVMLSFQIGLGALTLALLLIISD